MITLAVKYTLEEQKLIKSTLQDTEFGSKCWGEEKLEALRSLIKKHYIAQQAYQCCYCRQRLYSNHGRPWDVEHIIAMSLKPKFMFEPQNLAVACVECNQEKRAKPVTDSKRVSFPTTADHYAIVHPHFDVWEDHIELEGEATYHSLSKKGSFTIYECDLFRFRQREAKIRKPIKDRRFERDVGELRFAKTEDEARVIVASIMERVKIEEERAARTS
ncbi:HNH endonuclease [Novosphingobium aerophilum]|uniref:HNH endonuclease n=1 Tax=Novosphingobium aerophilum TaxID=2839843 RepID=UPI003FD512FD